MDGVVLTKENALKTFEQARKGLIKSYFLPANVLLDTSTSRMILDELGIEYKKQGAYLAFNLKDLG